MNTGPREWDAETYDAVSDPAVEWGDGGPRPARAARRRDRARRRLRLAAGSPQMLIERLPEGSVIAVDGSESMIEKARERLGDRGRRYLVADLAELELDEPVDVVFSSAPSTGSSTTTASSRACAPRCARAAASPPSAAAQGNIAEHAQAIADGRRAARVRRALRGHRPGCWNFAGPEETEARLRGAGFAEARCWLRAEAGRSRRDPLEFTSHRHPRPAAGPAAGGAATTASSKRSSREPSSRWLDYVRLNIEARRASD